MMLVIPCYYWHVCRMTERKFYSEWDQNRRPNLHNRSELPVQTGAIEKFISTRKHWGGWEKICLHISRWTPFEEDAQWSQIRSTLLLESLCGTIGWAMTCPESDALKMNVWVVDAAKASDVLWQEWHLKNVFASAVRERFSWRRFESVSMIEVHMTT